MRPGIVGDRFDAFSARAGTDRAPWSGAASPVSAAMHPRTYARRAFHLAAQCKSDSSVKANAAPRDKFGCGESNSKDIVRFNLDVPQPCTNYQL